MGAHAGRAGDWPVPARPRHTTRPPATAEAGEALRYACVGLLATCVRVPPSLHDSRAPADGRRHSPKRPTTLFLAMSPFWIWTQIAIVVFVVIGMVVAITKLA